MGRKVLIIGAGPAGLAATEAAAGMGANVTLRGAEQYPPYWRPRLTHFLAEPVPAEKLAMRKPEWYAEKGIELLTGKEAAAINLSSKTVSWKNGGETPWDTVVLAMGSSPNMPAIAGAAHALALRSYDDAVRVRETALRLGRAVIVGGGLLGLETAWELNAAGVKATLIERSPWLLPRQLNRAGGQYLEKRLASSGINLIIGRDPSTMQEYYQGACVVLCAGVQANLSLLKGTGIAVNRAIVVDDQMRTSEENIYACGDAAEYNGRSWGLIAVAQEQGKVAGTNAAGGDTAYADTPPSPMLKVGAHSVFSVGDVSEGEGVTMVDDENDDDYSCLMLRDDVLIGAVLVGNTAAGAKLKKAVGEHRSYKGMSSAAEIIASL